MRKIVSTADGDVHDPIESPALFVKTPAASQLTAIPVPTLETMRVRGGGPVFSKIGKSVYYRVSDLVEWMSIHARKNTSDGK